MLVLSDIRMPKSNPKPKAPPKAAPYMDQRIWSLQMEVWSLQMRVSELESMLQACLQQQAVDPVDLQSMD